MNKRFLKAIPLLMVMVMAGCTAADQGPASSQSSRADPGSQAASQISTSAPEESRTDAGSAEEAGKPETEVSAAEASSAPETVYEDSVVFVVPLPPRYTMFLKEFRGENPQFILTSESARQIRDILTAHPFSDELYDTYLPLILRVGETEYRYHTRGQLNRNGRGLVTLTEEENEQLLSLLPKEGLQMYSERMSEYLPASAENLPPDTQYADTVYVEAAAEYSAAEYAPAVASVTGEDAVKVQQILLAMEYGDDPSPYDYPYVFVAGENRYGYNPFLDGLAAKEGMGAVHLTPNDVSYFQNLFLFPNMEENGTLGSR